MLDDKEYRHDHRRVITGMRWRLSGRARQGWRVEKPVCRSVRRPPDDRGIPKMQRLMQGGAAALERLFPPDGSRRGRRVIGGNLYGAVHSTTPRRWVSNSRAALTLNWTSGGPVPCNPSIAIWSITTGWFWDFGISELAAMGFTTLTLRWGLKRGLPSHIHSTGGRFGYKDRGRHPIPRSPPAVRRRRTQLSEIRGRYTNAERAKSA